MGMAGRGLAGGVAGMGRGASWLGGHATRAVAGGASGLGRLLGPVGMAIGAGSAVMDYADQLGSQVGASSGISGLSAEGYKVAVDRGLIKPTWAGAGSGSASAIEARGGAAILGMTRGESSRTQDALAMGTPQAIAGGWGAAAMFGPMGLGFYGGHEIGRMISGKDLSFGTGDWGKGVEQAYIDVDQRNSFKEFMGSGVNDVSQLMENTGMTRASLKTLAETAVAYEERNRGVGFNPRAGYSRMEEMTKGMQGALRGTALAGIKGTDVLKMMNLGGGDWGQRAMGRAVSGQSYLDMDRAGADKLLGAANKAALTTLSEGYGTTRTRRPRAGMGFGDKRGFSQNQLRGDVFEQNLTSSMRDKILKSTIAYKRGLSTEDALSLGRGSQEQLNLMSKHIREGFAGDTERNRTIVAGATVANSDGFKAFATAGMRDEAYFKRAAGIRAFRDQGKESAKLYNKYKGITGMGVGEMLDGTGARGGSELGALIEEQMQNREKGIVSADGEAKLTQKIRDAMDGLDEEDSRNIGTVLQSLASNSGSVDMQRYAMMQMANSRFKGVNKKTLAKPGSIGNKLKNIGAAFGNTKGVSHALGLSGDKAHKAYIRDYMKAKGTLPPSAKIALLAARRNDLAMHGVSAGTAGAEMASMSAFLDDKGMEKGPDTAAGAKIYEQTMRAGIGRSKPGSGGGSNQNYNRAVDSFARKLGEATSAVNHFIKTAGGTKHINVNEKTQNYVIDPDRH